MITTMKWILTPLLSLAMACSALAQQIDPLEQLQADPQKAYGTDYPYRFEMPRLTPSPKGYQPFYISHYARHGSRYYWSADLYRNLDKELSRAHDQHLLTAEGEAFRHRFQEALPELNAGWGELTQLGWEQHQGIARTMYERFPEVFRRGGTISAISSLSGRCVVSMAAFCQELAQCNPRLEITERSSRATLHGVVPTDRENPQRREFPRVKPRYEQSDVRLPFDATRIQTILSRLYTRTDSLGREEFMMAENLKNLYTSLPSIGHEGMMGNLYTDADLVANWEQSNLGSYSWVFGPQKEMIPILEDILQRALDVIEGRSADVASLRFGHDTCLGPLTVLMGINGADQDPEDPYQVKFIYQNWQTCKAANIQLIFYRSRKQPADILVKCLLNGSEATLPVPTTQTPYYRWSDFYTFYKKRCDL